MPSATLVTALSLVVLIGRYFVTLDDWQVYALAMSMSMSKTGQGHLWTLVDGSVFVVMCLAPAVNLTWDR